MKLKTRHKFFYGIGNLGYSAVNQTITNFFMFFGTSVLKLSGTVIGFAVAISTIWDALTDPVIGYFSDNKKLGVFGYRSGYILIGVIGVSVANIFIWAVPNNLPALVKFLWVLISLLLNETFCTMFSTPYLALCSDLVTEYNDRTEIQIYKTIFFVLGMVLPSVMLNIFLPSTPEFPQGQLNPNGYVKMAVVCSVIMLVCGLISLVGLFKISNQKKQVGSGAKFAFKRVFLGFLECLKNPQQKIIILGYSLSMVSATILTSVGLHFFTYCFGYSSLKITVLLAVLLFGMVISQPLWYRVSLNRDKKPTVLLGLLVSIFGVVLIMFTYILRLEIVAISFYVVALSIFIVGFGAGVLYSLPSSMYLDVTEKVAKSDSENSTAMLQSFLTFASNIFSSVALFVVGILLDSVKFNPEKIIQTRFTETGIAIILFLGVLLCLIGSFLIFSKYKLKEKDFKWNKK